jgi:hypothetical protein
MPRLLILLGHEFVGCGLEERHASSFQVSDVLIGPFDLDGAAGFPVAHGQP